MKPFVSNCLVVSPFNCIYRDDYGLLKSFFGHPIKIPSPYTTIIFVIPNVKKKFPKAHPVTWFDVIWFNPLAAPSPNPGIQSRNVTILRYPSLSGFSPGYQDSRNTTSDGLSELIIWSNCCALWEHEFNNKQFSQALINWAISLLTIGHQNRASNLNKVLWSWLWPANGVSYALRFTSYYSV